MRVLIFLLIALAFSPAKANPSPTFLNYAEERTVLIVKTCEDSLHWGSGVILDGDKILTAEHVIDDMEGCSLEVSRNGEESYPALVVASDPEMDAALLVATHDYKVRTSIAPSRLGEEITVTGYPAQLLDYSRRYYSVLFGYVSTKDIQSGPVKKDRISAPIYFGNSGGPVWNAAGQIVGIVSSGHMGAQGYFYIVRGEDLSRFLDSI